MKILVQKFGGTSVKDEKMRSYVIKKIENAILNGFSPVVVVSAMGRYGAPYATDTLLGLIDEDFKKRNKMASDLLTCCGEIISTVVLSNELYKKNIHAVPLTGGQAGIVTDSDFTDAKCIETNTGNIMKILSNGGVPVIAGFQGKTADGYFTTLGRGGSDTTASILGKALKAAAVEIYTDVDGIMTADPRIVKDAELIDVISYSEVFQLASEGAKVIDKKAVKIAMEGNIPIYIKNTMSDAKGTIINNCGDIKASRIITGVTCKKDRIQITIKESDNKGNKKYFDILSLLAANNISLDLINIFPDKQIFTIKNYDEDISIKLFNKNNIKYTEVKDCTVVAAVGSKMSGKPGVMAAIYGALKNDNINVLQTADSNMTIWCLVESKNADNAVRSIHKAFK
ncbi:aspartate kinase [Clostridium sp. BJN0001]|uniref:aspartate kinase n=1 Tax=Clostridium sp. BJN0001 TaxID=2930219 RepID=UPI001FD4B225|nr:aspartate kinase [Clostridium sp. BJN0001]